MVRNSPPISADINDESVAIPATTMVVVSIRATGPGTWGTWDLNSRRRAGG
jgi:hypothetical protein